MKISNYINKAFLEIYKEVNCFLGKRNKILFDHLPKCGGTSLIDFLESNFLKRKTYAIDGPNTRDNIYKFMEFSERQRYGYDLVYGHMANDLFSYVHPDMLKITVLRHPVSRIISHYYHVKRNPNHYLHRYAKGKKISDYVCCDCTTELSNWYVLHFSGLTFQDLVINPDDVIDRAFNNASSYVLIGFLDSYNLFVHQLCCIANLKYSNLKKINFNKSNIFDNISSFEIDLISEKNKYDIVFYNKLYEKYNASFLS